MTTWIDGHVARERARVTRDVRRRILDRDGWRCVYCRRSLRRGRGVWAAVTWPRRMPQIDHVIPVSRGGTSDLSNLAADPALLTGAIA